MLFADMTLSGPRRRTLDVVFFVYSTGNLNIITLDHIKKQMNPAFVDTPDILSTS